MAAPTPDLRPDADDAMLLAAVTGYYCETLKRSPAAQSYLTGRGIAHPGVVDHFRLGFSDRSLGLLLPPKQVKAGAAIRDRLLALGVMRATGHEHLRGSITVPVPAADGTGRVANVYGRKVLDGRLRKGTAMHTFLDDRRPGVWNVEAFGPADEVVVCGSMFDALTFWAHGYRNVTCSFGPVTDDLLAAVAEFALGRVLVTAEALVAPLLAAGVETFLVRLPPGLDVNAYALKTADPADALGALLRHAEWAGRGQPSRRPVPVPFAAEAAAAELLAGDDEDEGEADVVDGPKPETVAESDDHGGVPADGPVTPVEPPVRTASPVPPPPPADDVTITGTEVVMTFGTRRYRVRGFDPSAAPGALRVNLLVSNGVGLFVDAFDLYAHRHRKAFAEQAAAELRVEEATVKKDMGRVLLKLEELQDAALAVAAKPTARPDLTADDERAALALLRDPGLLDRIAADFGIVGGRANKLAAYLAVVSRKLDAPLSVLVQSTSAAGKTALVDAALAFCPPEDVVKLSALTGQSLYYMADGDLSHKVLAVAEEAGAARASYALKLLASEGELRIASTGKNSGTGRLVTQEYRVRGPTALFLTTTSAAVDEELANRCIVLTVAEDRAATRAVHEHQRRRETLAGLVAAEERAAVVKLHRDAQRLLRPVRVVNPWAEKLTFTDASTRTRRDHAKYLALIRVTSFVHQHQRPVRTAEVGSRTVEYIETTLEDIQAANDLAAAVLGRGLDDLPPQARNLVGLLDRMAGEACGRERVDRSDFRFTARRAREFTGWGQSQLKLHLRRLIDHEYVLAHRDRHARRTVYELAVTSDGEGRVLPGLIDVDELRRAEWSDGGENGPGFPAHRSGPRRGADGPRSGARRGAHDTTAPFSRTATPEVDHAEEG